jgi:hypothetical protein
MRTEEKRSSLIHLVERLTHGYAVMWPAISLPVLASVPILRMLQLRGEASA